MLEVGSRILVVRLDNLGDVLVSGPAIRAVAARASRVVMLAGPHGRAAAELLPGVDHVIEWCAPWIDPEPGPVDGVEVDGLIKAIAEEDLDGALIFTSFHQSPLPLALLLRLAGVPWIGAICEDYPGSLLDLRHHVPGDPPEPERARSLAEAAGFPLPPGDDGRLALREPLPPVGHLLEKAAIGPEAHFVGEAGYRGYVVLHPATSVPARAWPPGHWAAAARLLNAAGMRVVVTGTTTDRALTAHVAGDDGLDLGGRTGLAELASVLAGARAVVVANTGPAHLAAAVGAPVVSLFAPTVKAARWAPYGVPLVLLGDQGAACAGSRARVCPVPGHPCLSSVAPAEVVAAVRRLTEPAAATARRDRTTRPPGEAADGTRR
jgi:ADP-heptose:LPS heptosyltransferase